MSEKDIAKEIVIKMIEKDIIFRSEFPNAESTVDLICEAYKKIYTTVSKTN